MAQGRPVISIDLFDLETRKAIAIHDYTGTELLVSMTKVSVLDTELKEITANFAAYYTISKDSANLALNCCGRVRVLLGGNSAFHFSPTHPPLGKLTVDSFYKILQDDFGFGYEGPFRALTKRVPQIRLCDGNNRCERFDHSEKSLLFHPGMLDSASQGLNAAHSAPEMVVSGRSWLQTFCRRISALCGTNMTENVEINCTITDPRDVYVTGDVEVFSEDFKE